MTDKSELVEHSVAHKHLFTPDDWCMIPYCARYGLTKEKVKSEPLLEGLIMDKYVRDCGFSPGDSWVLIVKPTGECEFTPLAPGDDHWCCEKASQIGARLGPAVIETPPFINNHSKAAPQGGLDQRLKTLDDADLALMRAGSACLNSFLGLISGAPARVKPPRHAAAG